jgi:hypothetical protein
MQPEPQDPLAELIQRELARLPECPAPATLMPRVMARLEQRQKQWWRNPWACWPFAARVISLPLMAGTAAGVAWLAVALVRAILGLTLWQELLASDGLISSAWGFCATLGNALVALLGSSAQHWMLAAGVVIGLMYLTTVALGTACFRVVIAKR